MRQICPALSSRHLGIRLMGTLRPTRPMVLAKPLGMKPRDLAERLVAELSKDPEITETTVAGPGFINLRVDQSVWQKILGSILAEGLGYGGTKTADPSKVNVEYVSANPTGPMHVGHIRGAVVGDALANLLAFAGNEVVKEYYINDAGSQIDTLARSAFLRYREALGEDIGEIPAGLYPGDYLIPVGVALNDEFGSDLLDQDEADWLPKVKQRAIAAMLDLIRSDLAALGVEHEVFFL
jgi:arginyl-tRNA synthetase